MFVSGGKGKEKKVKYYILHLQRAKRTLLEVHATCDNKVNQRAYDFDDPTHLQYCSVSIKYPIRTRKYTNKSFSIPLFMLSKNNSLFLVLINYIFPPVPTKLHGFGFCSGYTISKRQFSLFRNKIDYRDQRQNPPTGTWTKLINTLLIYALFML